jgi:uncharacterized membrane protein YkgB
MYRDAESAPDLEQRVIEALPDNVRAPSEQLDETLSGYMERYGLRALRLALGTVLVWFGALKLIGRSPVEDVVADTLFWLPRAVAVRGLGVLEVLVGVGLMVPVALRATLALFWMEMAGTFLVFVTQPRRSFQSRNPLLLTTVGEFVVKNLVLVAAGIVVGSSVHRRREQLSPGSHPRILQFARRYLS